MRQYPDAKRSDTIEVGDRHEKLVANALGLRKCDDWRDGDLVDDDGNVYEVKADETAQRTGRLSIEGGSDQRKPTVYAFYMGIENARARALRVVKLT